MLHLHSIATNNTYNFTLGKLSADNIKLANAFITYLENQPGVDTLQPVMTTSLQLPVLPAILWTH